MAAQVAPQGTKEEQKTFLDVSRHYDMSTEDLDIRRSEMDEVDELFRSHINESTWPYRSLVFDPRVFTAIFEKTSRLISKKPRGRFIPREGGDSLKAKIINEYQAFQWDDSERADGVPMLSKWAMMDMNARKYGASFALVTWHYDKSMKFDGPTMRTWNNRDVLHNPSYSTIKKWIQLRDYNTLDELQKINEASRSKPKFENLDLLFNQMLKQRKADGSVLDTREADYAVKNKEIKGLSDYLGRDELFRTVEIVTEYRNDRWITFAPKYGVVLRDIENPYDHGQIPVVMLKYYPIDDDIYGLSEIEPVMKLQRAINALICQYIDEVNVKLYPIIMANPSEVRMHTLEFGPEKKWLMNRPGESVRVLEVLSQANQTFQAAYSTLVSSFMNAIGETSMGVSNIDPFAGDKTATEVQDMSLKRTARDNFNQIYLSQAIKQQQMLWFMMNKQFLFADPKSAPKILRVVGKDALRYFVEAGLDKGGLSEEVTQELMNMNPEDLIDLDLSAVSDKKMILDQSGNSGALVLEKDDFSGSYDYIADVESMELPNKKDEMNAKRLTLEIAKDPVVAQLMAAEGKRMKFSQLMEDWLEELGFKDADKYFEKLELAPQGGMGYGAEQGTGVGPATGAQPQGNGVQPGMEGGHVPQVGIGGQA
jgi:hypothetical protein